jgi:arylsulfatase
VQGQECPPDELSTLRTIVPIYIQWHFARHAEWLQDEVVDPILEVISKEEEGQEGTAQGHGPTFRLLLAILQAADGVQAEQVKSGIPARMLLENLRSGAAARAQEVVRLNQAFTPYLTCLREQRKEIEYLTELNKMPKFPDPIVDPPGKIGPFIGAYMRKHILVDHGAITQGILIASLNAHQSIQPTIKQFPRREANVGLIEKVVDKLEPKIAAEVRQGRGKKSLTDFLNDREELKKRQDTALQELTSSYMALPKEYQEIFVFLVPSLVAGSMPPVAIQPGAPQPDATQNKRPNIMLLVFDDVGFADMAPFGGDVETPTLDSLVKSGVKITDFHTTATCAPSRSMLLTGLDNHMVGLGTMAETLLSGQKDKPGYEGYLNERVATVAELLRDHGYHTYMTGKWHLGGGQHEPSRRGFEETFILVQGMGRHFDDTPPSQGSKAVYLRNGQQVPYPAGQYAAEHDTTQMIQFIDAHKADGKPFFGYLALRAAHDPLQAPADWIAKFKGRYDAGYEVLRAERVARMKQRGLIPEDTKMARWEEAVKQWNTLSPEEQVRESRAMEIYAAMIAHGDFQLSRVLNHLREIGAYDNTVFIFLTDNGPNAETIAFYGRAWINSHYDNSLANLGNANSFVMMGPGWAQASAGPFRLFKGFVSEGGTRVPLIISGPGVKRVGETKNVFTHAIDITPTILELAGVKQPATYNGQAILPIQGTSLVPFLSGKQDVVHPPTEAVGWGLWKRGALRMGDWKILYVESPFGSDDWELYNLKTDPAESRDLGPTEPAQMRKMLDAWDEYVQKNGVVIVQ